MNITHINIVNEINIEKNVLYVAFCYGTGDTFTALFHLKNSDINVNYKIICKHAHLDIVRLMVGLLKSPPIEIIDVSHFYYDIDYLLISKFRNITRIIKGIDKELLEEGLLICWHDPINYMKYVPVGLEDTEELREHFLNFETHEPAVNVPENSVLLFQKQSYTSNIYPKLGKIIPVLRELGYNDIFYNSSGIPHYGDEAVSHALPLSTSIMQLVHLCYSLNTKITLLGLRSGIFDLLRFSRQRAFILYDTDPSWLFDKFRLGVLQHNLDLYEYIYAREAIDYDNIRLCLRKFMAMDLLRNPRVDYS